MVSRPVRPRTQERTLLSALWSLLWVVIGWLLFGFCWIRVLRQTDVAVLIWFVEGGVIVLNVVAIATILWIRHNRRLAARGSRGRATAFRVPRFERDGVDRVIVLSESDRLAQHPVLVVSATESEKIYAPPSELSRM